MAQVEYWIMQAISFSVPALIWLCVDLRKENKKLKQINSIQEKIIKSSKDV